MTHHLRRALGLLSPALAFLMASCQEKTEASSHEIPAHAPAAKGEARPAADQTPALAPRPSDPEAALHALTAANASEVRDILRTDSTTWPQRLRPFYLAWAQLDPEAAIESAATEEKLAYLATLQALEAWTGNNPNAARDWISSQPDQLQARYGTALLKAWPDDEFSALASWAQDQPALLIPVALKWSATTPSAAARWLGSTADHPQRRQATEALFRQWTRNDPVAAGEFLGTITEPTQRDAALSAYAATVARDDLEAAQHWAGKIADPELRASILAALPRLAPLTDSGPSATP